jgi:hypothetical protein
MLSAERDNMHQATPYNQNQVIVNPQQEILRASNNAIRDDFSRPNIADVSSRLQDPSSYSNRAMRASGVKSNEIQAADQDIRQNEQRFMRQTPTASPRSYAK